MISPELFRVIGSTFFVVESTPAASNAAKTGSPIPFRESNQLGSIQIFLLFFLFLLILLLLLFVPFHRFNIVDIPLQYLSSMSDTPYFANSFASMVYLWFSYGVKVCIADNMFWVVYICVFVYIHRFIRYVFIKKYINNNIIIIILATISI